MILAGPRVLRHLPVQRQETLEITDEADVLVQILQKRELVIDCDLHERSFKDYRSDDVLVLIYECDVRQIHQVSYAFALHII